jgi:rhamnose utilization protein RhaD (predicted bifunctional aldolase and dehydrogenase)/NAD(P)-dependent dehydrogenase (short-subunit alcohol dehydrogenase family)
MENRWNDSVAATFDGDIGPRVYTSRLLGQDPALVLHGGGNTSVKVRRVNLVGDAEELLCVKGSGWDLENIDVPGFPAVQLEYLRKLAALPRLSDPQMVNELRTHMTDASAPTPSVEAILHAILPYRFVDHTHADAVVTVSNTDDGLERIKAIYGDKVVIIPYVMPGFDLARRCAIEFERQQTPKTIGMVLMNHGIFSFGETARESYERMIQLVSMAEEHLKAANAWELEYARPALATCPDTLALARLRQTVSAAAGGPMLMMSQRDDKALSFCARADVADIAGRGPATPDHVIRTKRIPMIGRDVAAYADEYRRYFETHAAGSEASMVMLDPAPRVVLDPEFGVVAVAKRAKDAGIIADIYAHTMDIILRAERLGGWRALPPKDIFEVEYWDLEQAKLRQSGGALVFAGEVALVTGAASGIGKACVDALLKRGAAVIALDIDPKVTSLYARPDFFGLVCDLGEPSAIVEALNLGVAHFGGLDMLILNAGVFPGGKSIRELADSAWHQVMRVNLDANLSLLREAHPYLKLAPKQGRVVIMGSKNVPAPGPGAAAYSASKAALTQLMRIAALEWGADGIRLNALHPDAVFDTGIWTDEVLNARASHYGMSVQDYKRKNVLKTEITSRDVAELAAELCGPLFSKTTAAQIPIDGGNDRVI